MSPPSYLERDGPGGQRPFGLGAKRRRQYTLPEYGTILIVAFIVALAAAAQATATREEEAEGYLDHLLGRPVARLQWLTGRVTVSTAVLIVLALVAGSSIWTGAALSRAGQGVGSLIAAGLNVVPAAIFVLGIGTLAHGVTPRLAGPITYAVVAWSFLIEMIGASLGASRWVLDLSVFHHIARARLAAARNASRRSVP